MTGAAADELTCDRLLNGRVALWQPRRGYRAGIDPVFLAAATPAGPGETVLEIGTGAGAALLCLASRVPLARIAGIEIDPAMAALAARNARENGAAGVEIVAADIAAAPPEVAGPFDHVMANPPFLPAARGSTPPDGARRQAMTEGAAGLSGWIGFAAARLRRGGSLTLVHRADRLDDMLAGLRAGGFGGVVVFPLWPRSGSPAVRVIVAARRGSRAPLTLAAGLVLHGAGSAYTAAADAVLRDGAALPLG